MELKKNPRADLRRYAGLFFEAGLVVALGAVLASFNYSVHEKNILGFGEIGDMFVEEDIIPVTRTVELTPPPVPPAPPKVVQILDIIDDDSEEKETVHIDDVEATQDTKVIFIDRTTEEEDAEPDIFYKVESDPVFPGGIPALVKYISQNIEYSPSARDNGVQGKIHVRFVVNAEGKVENAQIIRGLDPSLDKEVLRVVQNLPKWTPGKQQGRPVKVWFTLPISFHLN